MARSRKKAKNKEPLTTAQQLSSIIKSARDIMRKDKGLSGDLDRLPMLTWIMFLKFLDDMEDVRKQKAKIAGKRFRPAIESPYRWRDWAAKEDGITGPELIAFVNQDEAVRPDGKRGPGLFAYLRSLQSANGTDRRDVIAAVFRGVINRMINGYLLRDVINKVNGIHFSSSEEIHTLGFLYESMLKEMRDAAGDSGEFYTPRPVVRFMVEVTNPQLGETVLDPACGTGGFLAETYNHLEKQCKTVKDGKILQEKSIFGGEAKPLPFMLGQMNLLLHGLEYPQIRYDNSLNTPLNEIGDKDRIDIVLTNPPFGGEEEPGIKNNFPADKQTSETALLFLQLIMRKLKRPGHGSEHGGRAAVVVPNGTLYATGVAMRVRRQLLGEFNLHTVVRLPKGVFEPYADIPTNILFFDRSKPSRKVWFYGHPLPPHRAALRAPCYSQSVPLRFEEFEALLDWWHDRSCTKHAWCVDVATIAASDFNLDQKNPFTPQRDEVDLRLLASDIESDSEQLVYHLTSLHDELKDVAALLDGSKDSNLTKGPLGKFCDIVKGKSPTLKTQLGPYKFVVTSADRRTADHYQFDGPAVCIPMISSTGHGHAAIHRIHFESGKFALANIMAAVVVKRDFALRAKYLYYYLWHHKDAKLVSLMAGTANTSLTIAKLQDVPIAFPPIEIQDQSVEAIDRVLVQLAEVHRDLETIGAHAQALFADLLYACIGEVP